MRRLWCRCAEGDLEQLAILYKRYRDPVYDFFSRLTGNRVISEDLVHDVFVRILKYRNTYQETRRFVTWMYQIGRNARADYLRRHNTGPIEQSPLLQAAQEITSPESQRLYVHDGPQPVLVVNDLKQRQSRGQIALWIGPGTIAHFANLRVSR